MDSELRLANNAVDILRQSFLKIEKDFKDTEKLISILTFFIVETTCSIAIKEKSTRKEVFNKLIDKSLSLISI